MPTKSGEHNNHIHDSELAKYSDKKYMQLQLKNIAKHF